MRFLILGRSVGLKKKNSKKKNHKESRNSSPCYPRMSLKVNIYIFGLTKCTIYCKKNVPVFVPVFCSVFSTLILCSCFRLKELFQVKNGLTTLLLLFFSEMPKIWVGRTTLNGEKKEDGQISNEISNLYRVCSEYY